MRLGIDFGTTHTVVAVCDRGNYPVLAFSRPDGELSETYPTLIAARGAEIRYGLAAEAVAGQPGWRVVRSFKRLLSDAELGLDSPVRVGERDVPIIELVTGFLRTLRADILGCSNLPSAPDARGTIEAAIATPANAHSPQRLITLEAFRRSGFEVIAVLDEPSASGIEYAHRYANTVTTSRQQVLVYDLGGGTFDASLVDMRGAQHQVVASSGVARLGGDDFDEALVELVLRAQQRQASDLAPEELDALRLAAREQKERLHPNSRRVMVETRRGPVQIPVEEYYAAVEPLIARTLEAVERTLEDAGVERQSLSGVYVVGGASALPPIGRALRAAFGRLYHRSAYPSASAAIGLAIAYDAGSPYQMRAHFARRFGVFREVSGGAAISFDPILGGDTDAAGLGEPVEVVRRYRATHNVGHFRFIECDRVDESGSPQGDLSLSADVRFPFDPAIQARNGEPGALEVPVVRLEGEGPLIEERYTLGQAGEVQLEIVSLDTGYRRQYRFGGVARPRGKPASEGASDPPSTAPSPPTSVSREG